MTEETIIGGYAYPSEWRRFTGHSGGSMNHELVELMKSIRNRANAAILLCHFSNVAKEALSLEIEPILHTVLEDLYEDAQTVVEKYCVKDHV